MPKVHGQSVWTSSQALSTFADGQAATRHASHLAKDTTPGPNLYQMAARLELR